MYGVHYIALEDRLRSTAYEEISQQRSFAGRNAHCQLLRSFNKYLLHSFGSGLSVVYNL